MLPLRTELGSAAFSLCGSGKWLGFFFLIFIYFVFIFVCCTFVSTRGLSLVAVTGATL